MIGHIGGGNLKGRHTIIIQNLYRGNIPRRTQRQNTALMTIIKGFEHFIIRQLKAVRQLVRNNQRLYDIIQDDLREILHSPFIKPEEVTRISDSFTAILENSLESSFNICSISDFIIVGLTKIIEQQ